MRLVVPAKVDEYLELGRPVVATRLPGDARRARRMRGDAIGSTGPTGPLRRWQRRLPRPRSASRPAPARRSGRRLRGRPAVVAGRHGALPDASSTWQADDGDLRTGCWQVRIRSSTSGEPAPYSGCVDRCGLGSGLPTMDDVWLRSPPDPRLEMPVGQIAPPPVTDSTVARLVANARRPLYLECDRPDRELGAGGGARLRVLGARGPLYPAGRSGSRPPRSRPPVSSRAHPVRAALHARAILRP